MDKYPYDFDLVRFIYINLLFIYIIIRSWRRLENKKERIFLLLSFSGIHFFNGLGLSNSKIPLYVVLMYLVIMIMMHFSFLYFYKRFKFIKINLSNRDLSYFDTVINDKMINRIVILGYLIISLFPLLYPNFNISKLFNPRFELLKYFSDYRYIESYSSILLEIMKYAKVVFFPFFLLAIYRYKNNLIIFLILFILPLYFEFVIEEYTGRSRPMAYLLIGLITYIYYNKKNRKLIYIISFFVFPLILTFLANYTYIRQGKAARFSEAVNSIEYLYFEETEITYSGYEFIKMNQKIDHIGDYFVWIITLPLPKLIIGDLNVPRINYDIAEIYSGVSRESKFYSVTLTGFTSESYYLYGAFFFWIHGIFIGFLMAISLRILTSKDMFFIILIYFAFSFGYFFARAGISSLLPIIINHFILFYIILFRKLKPISK